jgi:hypothetical protein
MLTLVMAPPGRCAGIDIDIDADRMAGYSVPNISLPLPERIGLGKLTLLGLVLSYIVVLAAGIRAVRG